MSRNSSSKPSGKAPGNASGKNSAAKGSPGTAVRAAAARALAPVLIGKGSLSQLDDHQVVARDRGLLKELCYGTCRALPRLEVLGAQLLERPFKARDADVHALLLVGI
ncbi:MAG: transcription antitermination factor NusB, partial [Halomonas sp.]|uniref:transcription antitermination factor NusB n=1 Tax=Halomonas sp. TaxID=1486246 RepID=UPI003F8EA701